MQIHRLEMKWLSAAEVKITRLFSTPSIMANFNEEKCPTPSYWVDCAEVGHDVKAPHAQSSTCLHEEMRPRVEQRGRSWSKAVDLPFQL